MATCANCGGELESAWKYCIHCGSRTDVPLSGAIPLPVPAAVDDDRPRVNVMAVLALILACLASPLAALFGHIAVSQIAATGERGLVPAWIAVVLGYLWLVALAVLSISYLTTSA